MLPNLTNPSSTIESRANRFLQRFNEVAGKHERVHIVAHSFAGIDIRAMITFYDLQSRIASLSTVCSPHNGLTLLNKIEQHPHAKQHIHDALLPVGLNAHNVNEFLTNSMSEINEDLEGSELYNKFSYGSRTNQFLLEKMLRNTSGAIMDEDPLNDNDGITQPDDCRWGDYLLSFEASHYQTGGLDLNYDMGYIYGPVMDNIKITEAKTDRHLAEEFGLVYQEF
jgi:hypothetical protein